MTLADPVAHAWADRLFAFTRAARRLLEAIEDSAPDERLLEAANAARIALAFLDELEGAR